MEEERKKRKKSVQARQRDIYFNEHQRDIYNWRSRNNWRGLNISEEWCKYRSRCGAANNKWITVLPVPSLDKEEIDQEKCIDIGLFRYKVREKAAANSRNNLRLTGAQKRHDASCTKPGKMKWEVGGEEDRSREGYVRVYFCPVCSRNHPF